MNESSKTPLVITIFMLAAGGWLAGYYGDFSMRAGNSMNGMPMDIMKY